MCDSTEEVQEPRRVRHSVHLRNDVFERARNAAAALAGAPLYLTLGTLMDGALERELGRLEKKHNRGRPFTARPGKLRGGRRPGATVG